jgi:acyl-CoA synthetase (NDP forming)
MTAIANVRLPRPQSLRAMAENLMTVPSPAFQLDTRIQKAACAAVEALLQDAAEQAYVVDADHELIGVIRATDLLRHLAAADAGCLTKFGTSLAGC